MSIRKSSLFFLTLLAVAACSSSRGTRFSGFLTSYDDLVENPDVPGNFASPRGEVDLSIYSKVYIAPIEIWPDPDADYGGLSIQDAQRVADDFLLEFHRALTPDYPMTADAGPGVLYLRIALTDLVPSSALRNWKRSLSGTGPGSRGANAHFENAHFNISGVTIEAEGFDGESGVRLFGLVQSRATSRGRSDSTQTWDSVQNDLKAWAKGLRDALDRAHGR